MGNTDLWKYCTKEQAADFLLSFRLFGNSGLSPQEQIATLYSLSNHIEEHYHPFTIPKRDGSPRKLMAPDSLLKMVQENILRHILEPVPCSSYATAYQKGVGLIANAQPHVGQKQILKLDIEDFFSSILFTQVWQSAFPSRYFPPAVSTLLTQLCCYQDALPQGAPTSAAISNLVMRSFDDYIGTWCLEREIVYTRYCDDMTFSGAFDAKLVKDKVANFLQEMGLNLNLKKTKLISKNRQQSVTGIVVNDKPQVAKRYRKDLRQAIYYCQRFGVASHLAKQKGQSTSAIGQAEAHNYLLVLLGKVNFVLQVNPVDPAFQEAKIQIKELLSAHHGN